MSTYPECDKLAAAREESQAISGFLEWLTGEKGFSIARRPIEGEEEHMQDAVGSLPDDYFDLYGSEGLVRVIDSAEKLLAEFFGIDTNKLEQERRQMLAELRKQHG